MTVDTETVSVALCTFNGARYVGEQIASILRQSRSVDEIVLADDGSRDGTAELVDALVAAYPGAPRLTLPPVPSAPLGVARNFERAVRAATGSIVLLADQDDIWSHRRVERALAAFQGDPGALLVASDADLIDSEGRRIGMTLFERMGATSAAADMASADGFAASMKRSVVPGMAMACRRALFELSGDVPASWPHDYWWMMVATSHAGFRLISENLVEYRQHEENVVGAGSRRLSVRLRHLIDEPSESARLLAQFTELKKWLRSARDAEGAERMRALVQRRVEFEQARVDLPRQPWRRVPALIALLRRTPGYQDFESNGRWNALRDVAAPRPAKPAPGATRDHARPVIVFVDRKKGRGGGQVVLEELCRRLDSRSHLLVITSPELATRIALPVDATVLTSDSDLTPLLETGHAVIVSNTNADVAYAARLARRLARAGSPVTCAAIIHNHPKTWLHKVITRALLTRVDIILPVEPGLAFLSRRSVSLPWLSTSPVETRTVPATGVVKCYARPDPTKGLDLLAGIYEPLAADGVHCRVALGESLEVHPSYVEKLRADLQPWLEDGPRTADWIQPGDIFVVPSVAGEAVCLSAQEAMARGAAVVASRIGLMPILANGGGSFRTFPVGDTTAAAQAILALLALPDEDFIDGCQTNIDVIAAQDGRWYAEVIDRLTASFESTAHSRLG